MLTTSPLGFPYPVAGVDPPNGPAQIHALADAVQQAIGSVAAGLQEGVIDAGSFEVTQASGGASMNLDVASNVGSGCFVDDDGISPARVARYYVPPTTAKTTVTIGTPHLTLPRVDAVVVSITGVVSVVAGTATAGATNDNARDGSHGGAVIPPDALHLADVPVPAAASSISNSQIRDRRKWANGIQARSTSSANTTSSSTATEIVATKLRVECSGKPIRVSASISFGITVDKFVTYTLLMDGVSQGARILQGRGATGTTFDPFWIVTPAAGSHEFSLAHASNDNATSVFTDTNEFLVEERPRALAANNTTTTG